MTGSTPDGRGGKAGYAVKIAIAVPNDPLRTKDNNLALNREATFTKAVYPGECELYEAGNGQLVMVSKLFAASPDAPLTPAPDLEQFVYVESKDRFRHDPDAKLRATQNAFARAAIGQMRAIHEKGFVHRDIKPKNLLIRVEKGPSGEEVWIPKIIDMGIAHEPVHEPIADFWGTDQYMGREGQTGRAITDERDTYAMQKTLQQFYFPNFIREGNAVQRRNRPESKNWWYDIDIVPEDGKRASPQIAWALTSHAMRSSRVFEKTFEKAEQSKNMDEFLDYFSKVFAVTWANGSNGDRRDMAQDLLRSPVYAPALVKRLSKKERTQIFEELERIDSWFDSEAAKRPNGLDPYDKLRPRIAGLKDKITAIQTAR